MSQAGDNVRKWYHQSFMDKRVGVRVKMRAVKLSRERARRIWGIRRFCMRWYWGDGNLRKKHKTLGGSVWVRDSGYMCVGVLGVCAQ